MKVICKEKKKSVDEQILTIGKEYLVLEIYLNENDKTYYRIVCDDNSIPILISAKQFDILDNRLPSNWKSKYEKEIFKIGPGKWIDDSLWQYSFWEDLCSDNDEKAKQVFKEELAKMMLEDEK